MAAWVEATTREMGHSLINPDKPSVSASALPGDTEKPALGPKPHLMPKPFALQRNATVRPIRAPKNNFSRELNRAASSESLFVNKKSGAGGPKSSECLKSGTNGTVNGSNQIAALKPISHGPKPDLLAKLKPEPTKSPGSNNHTGPNSKPGVTAEDVKDVQPRSRAKSLGSQDQKSLNQKVQGEATKTEADVKVSSRCWPPRNRLSVELTSKFESPSQPEKEVRREGETSKMEKEWPPHSPSESKPSKLPVDTGEMGDEDVSGGSIKRRISLLFDRSTAAQRRDTLNKRDNPAAEISVDIKQRIQNLSLDVPRTRLPSTGGPKSPPSEKTQSTSDETPKERSSEKPAATEKVPVDKPPSTTEIKKSAASVEKVEEEQEDREDEEEDYVPVPVYRRVGISLDAETKRREEEEKQRKDEQLEKERQQRERERLLEEERKAREIERQKEEERKHAEEEEKQRQMEERRKQEEERKRRIEEERKDEERRRQAEEEKRRIEEEKERLREEEKRKKEREMEGERRRILELERQKEEEKMRQEREKEERLKKEREMEERKRMEEERLKEEERLRQEREKERLKKEKEMEEERKRIQELEKQREEERLRKEREIERIRKEKEMEEERRRIQELERQREEEERLRQEREKERLKKQREMEERLKEEERLRQEREVERLKKEKEMEEDRRRIQEMERQKEEKRLKQEREKERLQKEKEMEEEQRRIQELERQREEERLRKEREIERIRKEKEVEEERRRIQELERQKEEERLRKEQELERIRKEKEMEEERRRIQELERQREEERLRKERELEKIRKEKEMEEERRRIQELERQREEERLRKEREIERIRKEKETEEERQRIQELARQKEEERLRKEQELEKIRKEKEMEEERRRIQELERQREEERLRKERELEKIRKEKEMEEERQRIQRQEREIERLRKEREIEERKQMEEERQREEERLRQERERERLKKEKEMEEERRRFQEMERLKEEKLRQERAHEMETCKAAERLREEVPTSYDLISFGAEEPAESQTLVSTVQAANVSPRLTEVIYEDFSVKPRRWGTRARRSSTPSPSRDPPAAPDHSLQPESKSSDPGPQEPSRDQAYVHDLIGFEPEASSPHNPTESRTHTYLFEEETESKPGDLLEPEIDEGQLKDGEPEEDGVAEQDTENLIEENNDTVDDNATQIRINQALQRLTRRRNTSTDSDAADVPVQEEPEPLPVLESVAPLLDSSVFRSRVDLGKKRSIKRSRPSRAVRQRAALPALTEGPQPDWRFCDSTEAKDQCSNGADSESEEEPSRDVTSSPAPSQSKRVPVFPGMDPSALMAQLKRRSGVIETESPTEAQTPPSVPSRSPRTPTMALGPRVLPPVDAKDSGSGSPPSWLLELKSKKRMSQPESEA